MNGLATAMDGAVLGVDELDFARLELRAEGAYLKRRVAIATVKQEHALLTADEQDDISSM